METENKKLLNNELISKDIIENVHVSAFKLMFSDYRGWLYLSISLSLLLCVILFFLIDSPQTAIFAFLFFALGPFVVLYAVISSKAHRAFMRQFARANNFSYEQEIPLPVEPAYFFKVGRDQKVGNFITGKIYERIIHLFNFATTVQTGKNSRRLNYTVFNINLPYTLPSAILVSDSKFLALSYVYGSAGKRRISLEPEIENFFSLWTEEKFEIEALQIFTQEFLHQLCENWPEFDIELVEQDIYVFVNSMISTKTELEKMLRLTTAVIAQLENKIERIASSTEAMKMHTSKK